MDKGSGSGIFPDPDPDPGDQKSPDPTGSGSGSAKLKQSQVAISRTYTVKYYFFLLHYNMVNGIQFSLPSTRGVALLCHGAGILPKYIFGCFINKAG